MAQQTQWIKDSESRRSRVDISGEGVLVASTCGPEGQEVGAVVSHQEFLEGKYQDVIRKVYGADVLAAMITGCEQILESRQGV
jgi:hypothetical protein